VTFGVAESTMYLDRIVSSSIVVALAEGNPADVLVTVEAFEDSDLPNTVESPLR
jgi:hypothetical protein